MQRALADGLDPYHAIIEATVQRSRPVILTALAAVLTFIPLTHSVFWGSMAYVLIGGTAVGTVLTLAFLPALYAIWFRVSYLDADIGKGASHRQGYQLGPVLPKISQPLDAGWLRQLCLSAGADDVGCRCADQVNWPLMHS